MKRLLFSLFVIVSLSAAAFAQVTTPTPQATPTSIKTKKPPIFRANKDQVIQAQKMLKVAESGKLDKTTRAAIKVFQGANGLKATGTLNRATLEKMNITLTDKQKLIPVSPNSYATTSDNKSSTSTKTKKVIFRATKDQIMAAQKMLKEKTMYAGEQTGKLDDATRAGLKKFQAANGAKVTGTLNRETLEKMGIALTDKQKEM